MATNLNRFESWFDYLLGRVRWTFHSGGIPQINSKGRIITTGGGGYIIGSVTGADIEKTNLVSSGQKDYLRGHPQVPFEILAQPEGTSVALKWTIGPLPVELATLSVPLDLNKKLFDSISVDPQAQVSVGCGPAWMPTTKRTGRYTDIPTPCLIPGVGFVGQAFCRGANWIEAKGKGGRVRRAYYSGTPIYWAATNHPGTNNLEATFTDVGSPVPKGTVVSFIELITVD